MREHARLLFMQGEPQKVIAEKVGVSAQTITKWVNDGDWQAARSAANITRPELVNKILKSIDVLVEDLVNEPSPEKTAAAADKLVKFAATIERLDKKNVRRRYYRGLYGFQQMAAISYELRPECNPRTDTDNKQIS